MPSATIAPAPSDSRQATWLHNLLQGLPQPSPDQARVGEARAQLAGQILPNRRQERWRFTPLEALIRLDPSNLGHPPERSSQAAWPAPSSDSLRLVLDGQRDPLAGVELPRGLEPIGGDQKDALLTQTLGAVADSQDWPLLLHQAVSDSWLALRVTSAVQPCLELVSEAAAPGLLPVGLLLVLEPGAELHILQCLFGGAPSLTSLVLAAHLAPGARLRHGLLATGHPDAVLFAHQAIVQEPGSQLELTAATAGWGLSRLEPRVLQRDGGATSRLRGLQCVDAAGVADTHSSVRFEGPDGQLDQLHKVVADGHGRSIFNGAVQVPRAAQRTDAAQLSRALLLSDRACVDTKPELAIVADDVRCAHGATISCLQDDQLFYLRSRGIDSDTASRLLLRGWCEEVLRDLPAAAAAWQPLQALLGEARPQ